MKATRVGTTEKTDKTYVKKPALANMPKVTSSNTPKVKYGEERHRYLSSPIKPKKGK